ncbi:MAG: hypothetical protein YK1312THETA_360002 [Marine Group I thaumarchaeote]|nr:MAG: hypothetical protein YK1312THETA_360002 [Marine Group I thaumarchaeote]
MIYKSKVNTRNNSLVFRGPRSIVASIGDCGSPGRSSIPLEGPF